jgi:hypothetical protein
LFLTTNQVHQFDEAIQLVLKYDDLDRDARRNILVHFLTVANVTPSLTGRCGRQLTYNLAISAPIAHASGLAWAPQSQLTWQVEGFAVGIAR